MDSGTDFYFFSLLGEARLLPNFLVAFRKVKETCKTFLKMFLTHMNSITRILTQTMKVMNLTLFELFEVCEQILRISDTVCINTYVTHPISLKSGETSEVRRDFGLLFLNHVL